MNRYFLLCKNVKAAALRFFTLVRQPLRFKSKSHNSSNFTQIITFFCLFGCDGKCSIFRSQICLNYEHMYSNRCHNALPDSYKHVFYNHVPHHTDLYDSKLY